MAVEDSPDFWKTWLDSVVGSPLQLSSVLVLSRGLVLDDKCLLDRITLKIVR